MLPKPYYENELGRLYCGDCLDILPHLEPVDLVLTDPPFGIGIEYGKFIDTKENVESLINSVLPFLKIKSKIILIACGILSLWLYPVPDWVLMHFNPGAESSGKWGFATWMPILVYGKCPYLSAGKGRKPDGFAMRPQSVKKLKHPCPKNIGPWMWLINRATTCNLKIVLDPFIGSGTTAVACERMKRRWIGIEIEEKYCAIAVKRIEAERKQLKLF